MNLFIENDADVRTDQGYSHGGKLSALFLRKNHSDSLLHIPFIDYKVGDSYISFSYAQELFTPEDIEATELVIDDRPYAGYMNLQVALHNSSHNVLRSLTTQVGIVGPSAKMEQVQKFVHSIVGSPTPEGWDNQLHDELIFQLNYGEKRYYKLEKIKELDSVIITDLGFELGNASTKLFGGAMWRLGWGVPEDYGTYSIDNHSYSKVPLKAAEIHHKKEWDFCFNFALRANAIARNIFLDGNSDGDSHSVEKENFVLEGSYGFSLIYDNMSLDYTRTHSTKEFSQQDNFLGYGSLEFSYNF